MKSEIKITGLIKSGGQLIGIKRGGKGGGGSLGRKMCEVTKFDVNAKNSQLLNLYIYVYIYVYIYIHRLLIYTSMKYSLLLLKTFSPCAQIFRLLIKMLSTINPSLACLVLLLSVVNNF